MSRAARTPRPAPFRGLGRAGFPKFSARKISANRSEIAWFEDPDGARWGVQTDCDRIALVDGVGRALIFIPTFNSPDLMLFAAAIAEAIGEARRWHAGERPAEDDAS